MATAQKNRLPHAAKSENVEIVKEFQPKRAGKRNAVRGGTMKARIAAVMISLFVIAVAVTAHGNKKHVMGILQSVSADAVTVKMGDGTIVTVGLTAATMDVI